MEGANGSNGKHTISVFVHDRPGVLSRVAQVFARRGYNIDSLVVSPAHDAGFSRMTIACKGDPGVLDQIIRQLDKLVDVVRVAEHGDEEAVVRELGLFKIKAEVDHRTEILQIVDVFRAKTVDIGDDSLIIEATGDTEKLDAMERMLAKFSIIEMIRSGKLIIARGKELT
ncbi:MAG: acetolactate synthase small subunit [Candidatus Omnitrophica bacterium]|nr:MAG: Acetolactate synthase small subunit [Candidatus Hinthialibacteria bacterium OLB16]MBE7487410.1 acetolactate synthase small subunit [bacterium]MBK7494096.1 acetolactate synthase small subunit [Candidatus Omnitrophota bacterium]MBV6480712.1 Acetolactate synthase small subunit [bacterium]MBW7937327.1 acetolactate synthase small subunit [Candidatus Omnitrophota bacterium]